MKHGPSLIVIGNGPSLRDVAPERFAGIDTIGMNAAYREWQRRDWWPTYYACADHRLALSHIAFFRDAAASGRFRRMLLPATVLDEAPELARNADVEFIDQYLPYWFARLGDTAGLARRQSAFFESTEPSLVTTGAISLRWGASLGYKRIGLIGIDCHYVPLPAWRPETESDLSLRMAETPVENPNYFFADYQREGDLFNVPQPSEHGSNLHLAAIAAVRDDIRIQHAAVGLTNLSEGSELSRRGTLPFQTLDVFLGATGIGLVVLDHQARWSFESARAQLAALGDPALLPSAVPEDNTAPELIMLVPEDVSAHEIDSLGSFFADDFYLPRSFSTFHIESGRSREAVLARFAADQAGFALVMDARALPLRFGWLDTLSDYCRAHGDAHAIGPGALFNPKIEDGATIDTPLIISIERQAAETLDDIRATFPAAVLALNAIWIASNGVEAEADSWRRAGDRLNIVEPPPGQSSADPWFLGSGLLARAAIGVRAMGGNFRPGDEIEIEARYTSVGGWLSIEIQAEDTGSTLAKSESFDTQGVGRHTFRVSLPSLSQALRIRIQLAEPPWPDGFDPIVRLDRIEVSIHRASVENGRARIERLRAASDLDDLDAQAIIEDFGQSRAFLDNGQSSFRHELAVSTGYGETERCSARYGEGRLIVALAGSIAVIDDHDHDSQAASGILRLIGDFARANAVAQE